MEAEMISAGKLSAVEVPWLVSPSVPEIRVTVEENNDAVATFDVAVLPENDPLAAELVSRRVEVHFKAGQWLRTYPAIDDANVVPPDLFDWGEIQLSGDDVAKEDHLIEFRKRWIATGVCPNPGIYEVRSSTWLAESRADRFKCKHFVVVGHDMWIEVLCKGISWRWAGAGKARAIDV